MSDLEESIISRIRARAAAGLVKYGTADTRIEWLRHAQEEALDLAVYLEKLIREEAEHE